MVGGSFLLNLFDLVLLVADVILFTSLLLPELLYSYAVSFCHLIAQLLCLVAPARVVDYVSPTLRQPKRSTDKRTKNASSDQSQSIGCALVHTQRAFYISESGELFRTEELTIDPIVCDKAADHPVKNLSAPVRHSMPVLPMEHDRAKPLSASNHNDSSAGPSTNLSSDHPAASSVDGSDTIIMFMITGNPGSCRYYETFLTHLARLSGHTIRIRCVSFAGHQSVSQSINQSFTSKLTDKQPRLYALPDQIELWECVIKQTLVEHPRCRIALAGHSIGAYIALQLLPLIPEDRLVHAYLMFPTLMQMAKTPDGAKLLPIFQSFRTPIACLGSFLSRVLPETVIRVLIRANIGSAGDSESLVLYENEQVVETTIDLMRYSVIQQMLYLAHSELELVKDMPKELISRFESKLTLICATVDGWNPPSHQHMLAAQFPHLRIRMMPASVKHAFVIGSSRLVASALWREMRPLVGDSKENCSSDSDDDLVVTRKVPMFETRPLH